MARKRNPIPFYVPHRQTGQARATWTDSLGIRRQKLLPGPFDSAESRTAFARLQLEILSSPARGPKTDSALSVAELLSHFWDHAERHYRHADGSPTEELNWYRFSMKPVRELYGSTAEQVAQLRFATSVESTDAEIAESHIARLTPAVIGLTVVAAGTSVPELVVRAVAAMQGKVDITVGNVVGSNIFNIAFILGLAALIRPLAITGNTIKFEYPVLAVVTLLCVAVCDHGAIHRVDGVLFLVIYVVFIACMVSLVRKQLTADESQQLKAETQEMGAEAARPPRLLTSVGLLLAGIALLTGGAHATVTGASDLGRLFGLTERVIGLTIVAAGTGLPEVVTSLVSSVRGRDDVAIGNVIGSNLFKVLCILGINALISPLPVAPEIAGSDTWWMLGVTVLLFPLMFTGRRVNRLEGAGLLAVYVVYTALLLAR